MEKWVNSGKPSTNFTELDKEKLVLGNPEPSPAEKVGKVQRLSAHHLKPKPVDNRKLW